MKKYFSKFTCIFMVFAVLLVSSLAVSAKMTLDTKLPYETINEFIAMEIENDPTCPWTNETQISEIIPTYDLNQNINGYIINLTTNGNATGYMMYDYTTDVPVLSEFGYEGVYSINGQTLTQQKIGSDNKIIYVQAGVMLIDDDSSYYTIGSNVNVTDQKDSIQSIMNGYKNNVRNIVQSPVAYEQIIYESVNVTNIFSSNYKPVYQSMYSGVNRRTEAIACANMLKYWTVCRGIPSLYNGYDVDGSGVELTQTVNRLARSMKLVENGKPNHDNTFKGIALYCNEFKCTLPKGNDNHIYPLASHNFDFWNWVTINIKNSNPFAISIIKEVGLDEVLKSDYYLGVGYQRTSTGDFIRIANSADSSLSHFINYSLQADSVNQIFYYRWI